MAGEEDTPHTPSTAAELPSYWTWKRLDMICDGVFDCSHSTPLLTGNGRIAPALKTCEQVCFERMRRPVVASKRS